ncbi:hypothetical protein [Bacillus thuringiensis]|nr:hypothetical protein [Bacillus thuringiensis]
MEDMYVIRHRFEVLEGIAKQMAADKMVMQGTNNSLNETVDEFLVINKR